MAPAVRVTAALSPREIEVLRAYCETHSRKETAISLGLKLGTVATHLESVRIKLGVADSWSACEVARDLGLLGRAA